MEKETIVFSEEDAVFDEPLWGWEQYPQAKKTVSALKPAKTYTDTLENRYIIYAESALSPQDIVRTQDRINSFLENFGLSVKGKTFFVGAYPVCISDSEHNAVYLSEKAVGTSAQILATMQMLLGDFTNYGYLYAMSERIAKELAMEQEGDILPEEATAVAEFSVAENLYRLSYPCFSEKYATVAQIAASKRIAVEVLSSVATDSDAFVSEENFMAALASYAERQGSIFLPDMTGYAYGGSMFPLRCRNQYFDLSVGKNYKDVWLSEFLGLQIMKTAEDVFFTADQLVTDVQLARNRVSFEGSSWVRFFLIGQSDYISEDMVYANFSGNSCASTTLYGFIHEYCHPMAEKLGSSYEAHEQRFCEWQAKDSYFHKLFYYTLYRENEECREWFRKRTGRLYEFDGEDFVLLCELNVAETMDFSLLMNNGSAHISFGAYLRDLYGEEKMLDYTLHWHWMSKETWKKWQKDWENTIRKKYASEIE